MNNNLQFKPAGKGIALAIHVVPRASQTELTEVLEDGSLKIRLNAPPVDGKANRVLIDYLAELFAVRRSDIEIVAGEHSRNKIVSIVEVEPEHAEKIITKLMKKG